MNILRARQMSQSGGDPFTGAFSGGSSGAARPMFQFDQPQYGGLTQAPPKVTPPAPTPKKPTPAPVVEPKKEEPAYSFNDAGGDGGAGAP